MSNVAVVPDPEIPENLSEMVESLDKQQHSQLTMPGVVLDGGSAKYQRFGLILIVIVFGGFGLWATTMPLDSATFAMGVVQAEGYRKPIQNLEGGIVERIAVSNGETVVKGQPLIYLDDTATLADLGAVEVRLFSALALLERLIAERDDLSSIAYPEFLLEQAEVKRSAREAIANETALFAARREDRLGEAAMLEQTVIQLNDKLDGLEAVRISKQSMRLSLEEEVSDLRALLDQGFVDKVRLRQLERSLDSTIAELASTTSEIASTYVAVEQSKLRMDQLNKRFKTEVIAQLSKASAEVTDLGQRYEALKERLERTVIKSNSDGVVLDLAVSAIGQVIRGGDTLMEIVPSNGRFLVKAQISPSDIDSVVVGDEAEIRFSAFKRVFTVTGRLTALSADRLTDPVTRLPYYDAEVDIFEDDLVLLGGRVILPGMPADILIKGESRTLFQYLTKPVDNMFARALIEE
jgi:epimerase transport system membrane fusion protein